MVDQALAGNRLSQTLFAGMIMLAGTSLLACEGGTIEAPGSGSLDGLLSAQTPAAPEEEAPADPGPQPKASTPAAASSGPSRGRPTPVPCNPISVDDTTCDGVDDDCDGVIDDDFMPGATECCAAPIPEPENKVLYLVTAAEADEFGKSGGHAFWLPGLAEDYLFEGDGGELLMDLDAGTARMTGTLASASNADDRWGVDLTFTVYPTGVSDPKRELDRDAYTERGGPVDPATWEYWGVDAGSVLVGLSDNDGTELAISAEIPVLPVQIGVGASGKNVNFGASEWVTYSDASGGVSGTGDFNVDLTELELPPPPPPETWTCDDGCSGQGTSSCSRGTLRDSCDFCVAP